MSENTGQDVEKTTETERTEVREEKPTTSFGDVTEAVTHPTEERVEVKETTTEQVSESSDDSES